MKKGKAHIAKFWPICESLLKYTFAALLIFVPLYPKFPSFFINGATVAVRAEDFIAAFLAIVTVPFVYRYRKDLFRNIIFQGILIYWFVSFVSLLNGVFVTHTTPLSTAGLHWARRIEYMFPFISALILVQKKTNLHFITDLLVPIGLGVLVYGIGQLYFGLPVISTQNSEFSKGLALTLQPGVNISSTFAGHYDLAAYLVMTLAITMALAMRFKLLGKLIQFTCLLGFFWLLLQTGNRIAFAAAMIAVPASLFLSGRKWIIVPVLVIGLIGGLSSPALTGRLGTLLKTLQLDTIEQKIETKFHIKLSVLPQEAWAAPTPTPTATATPIPTPTLRPIQEDRSTSIRLDVEWPRAIRAFTKNPLVGTGFGSITLATDNDYLRALGETGALGFLTFMSVILAICATLARGIRQKLTSLEHQYLIGVLAAIIGFLLIGMFIDVFESSKIATLFWMYTGLASGVVTKLAEK